MDSIIDILGKIETPLVFTSRESFKHLPLIKDLEGVMKNFLHQLQRAMIDYGIMIHGDMMVMELFSGLESAMRGFDSDSLENKKKRIEKAIHLLNKLKGKITITPIAGSGINSDHIFLEKLSSPVQFVKGVGPKIAHLLEKKGIKTIEDLLYFIPRRYEDRRVIKSIPSTIIGKKETVVGKVIKSEMRLYGKKRTYEVAIDDGHGILTAKWFRGNQAYLKKTFKQGKHVIMTGEVSGYLLGKDMIHPDYEILDYDYDPKNMLHFGRVVPIYSETEGLHQKYLRRIIMEVIDEYSKYVLSPLPEEVCRIRHLENIIDSIRYIHFPGFNEDIEIFNAMRSAAHKRLIYDEFFFFELGMALKRKGNMLENGIAFNTGGAMVNTFYRTLSFLLTQAQRRVIGEIEEDMKKPFSMNRLLQGDVGCGKTVVAMVAMITACENGYQSAMMAPTEILVEQHYARIREWTEKLGLRVAVMTSNLKASERKIIFEKIMSNDIHIIIGTHALIQEDVSFKNLGLVIIDEQHRFGVIQRATLRTKGIHPDVLVMTATPIPRTLAMTVYGDLDISIIDEMPPGRKEIRTKVFYEQNRNKVYEITRKELIKGNQIFIVYPLVEESENLDLKDATRMAEHLQKDIFPEFRVGLIHGRMKGNVKDDIMADFLMKKVSILVSTTVIEVGIDIPQASLMIIEHAERFGLSQLHQLRGRVGRGDIPSYCILMVRHTGSEDSKKRLRVIEKTNDGFKIAEEDLAIRGPGEFMGTRQSGLPDFRIANIIRDTQLLSEAKMDAFSIIEKDPHLEIPEHRLMKEVLLRKWGGRLDLAKTG
jgi:ATP-dependent DNA helicase RecG